MKLEEAYKLVVERQLEENRLKNAVAATALAAGTLMSTNHLNTSDQPPKIVHVKQEKKPITDKKRLYDIITKKFPYSNKEVIKKGIDLAHKYADPVFPQAHHILTIIGNESTWHHDAVGPVKHVDDEPAKGLMQVKFKTNKLDPREYNTLEGQIRSGAKMYRDLYDRTKDIHQALLAYNLGPTGAKRAENTESGKRYIKKFEDHVKDFLE